MEQNFKIYDWTGKECFEGKTFETFEDAWDFIYENDPRPQTSNDDHWYDDYEVKNG